MLTVYRASAGAGKTHKLTGEYLRLLFTQPAAFRRILAVTFTNKATDEMKGRIVEELYHLASGRPSDYVDMLSDIYGLTEKQLRAQASQLLIALLHDYSAFNISTIDRFFQQTMRAFTREIGLQGGYGIEMDQDLVLTEAIDRLLGDLDKPENKELLGWLLKFTADKIEGGGEWNVRRDIKSLGKEVFKESYKAFSEAVCADIADKQALEQYRGELYAVIRAVESEARQLGERGMKLIADYGLQPSDFKGGSRSQMAYFQRLAQGEMKPPAATFCAFADNEEGCYTKSASPAIRNRISCVFQEGLNDCIKAVVALFSDLTAYHTAKEVVRYYYTLGILTDISQQIARYREEKNVMLIADTTELLNKVIAGSNAPFIYEKTGTYIDHYMIDEFQDTSGMQWENFRPLMEESLAHQRDNLIVGDVKQSIYRFRNSDWKLLDEQVQQDFAAEEVQEETLKENWRSCRHIVDFNNALFTATPAVLQQLYNETLEDSSLTAEERALYATKVVSAYDKSYQQVPPPFQQKLGHVRIEFLEETDETDWKEEAMQRLPEMLEQLQDQGYALKDIALLVRTNQEGARIADALLAYKEKHPSERYRYDILSDEALFVNRSPVVRLLIALFRYLRSPESETDERMALYAYCVLTGGLGDRSSAEAFEQQKKALLALGGLPLYDMTEGLYRLYADIIPGSEQVFVQAFLDMVAEFSQKESPDLNRFLKWWDESGCRKTIATPDGQDAIRILTVHKSKGLGFKVVIVPFCDWEIDHKPTKPMVLWCHPRQSPFDRLHLVPVRYGSILSNTYFAKDYFEERLHAFIDNLNTLYVAFTRSKEELLVMAPRPKKLHAQTQELEKVTSIASLLWASLCSEVADTREGDLLITLPESFDREQGLFELGHGWHPEAKREDNPIEEIGLGQLRSISFDDRLQLRLYGKGFFFDDKRRKHGTLMHEVLSRIQTTHDVAASVHHYRQLGIIDRQEAEQLTDRLLTLLSQPQVAAWYDGRARVLNEVDILFGPAQSKRPDRVMIYDDQVVVVDYKFGKKQSRTYQGQVRNYLKLIRQMGYLQVKGYLWYIELDKIEEVKG